MVTLGVDAHKRTHTIVAVDGNGRQLASKTISTTTKDHVGLLTCAQQFAEGDGLLWAIEDCRHLSRRLERDLLAAGQSIVRVPPKLMAHVRDSARTYGKSDPIDALAVARAAQREPDLPVARLDGPDREVRLLSDHRESLMAERTRAICRLRWHLHELDPSWEPKSRSLDRLSVLDHVASRIENIDGVVARLARGLVNRCRELTVLITDLTAEITTMVTNLAPALIAIPGGGPITAAKIVGQTAGVDRFRSKDAFARHTGTAPLPVWSSNKARHRLSRTGNRQLNAALNRIALTQAHWHVPAKLMLQRRKAGATAASKHSACSNDVSPTSSTPRCAKIFRSPRRRSLLDRGASAAAVIQMRCPPPRGGRASPGERQVRPGQSCQSSIYVARFALFTWRYGCR